MITSPYPWMGGKSSILDDVWARLGDCPNAVDPFFGSNAFLLCRPQTPQIMTGQINRIETVNDLNAWLTNFWRAVAADPEAVAYHASWPVSELDLHARGDWLFYRVGVEVDFVERLRSDPDYYDVKSAGWWVWGQSNWIGDNWGRTCKGRSNAIHDLDGNAVGVVHGRPFLGAGQGVNRQLPHLSDAGAGINRKLPHLSDAGAGINRKLPHLSSAGKGLCEISLQSLTTYMFQLADRFRKVRICCGDWRRVLTPAVTTAHGMTAVFLDPPYGVADRNDCYGLEDSRTVAGEVLEWCKAHGQDPLMRIALCGYDGEHNELEALGWEVLVWSAKGGYANQGSRSTENRHRERIWFSPNCIKTSPLLAMMEDE